MSTFDLFGYSIREPYSIQSETNILFALIPSEEGPPVQVFRPILMFI
jgi:hypothetical protein